MARPPLLNGGAGAALGRVTRLVGASRPFAAAAGLSAVWLSGVIAYAAGFFGLFEGALLGTRAASALEIALFALAALAPITLFFYGALLAQKAEDVRAETTRLAGCIDALRASPGSRAEPPPASPAVNIGEAVKAALGEERAALSAALLRLDAALAENQAILSRIEGRESAARRDGKLANPAAPTDAAQHALPLEPDAAAPEQLRWDSVVRALDFPRDKTDKTGFAALRATLKDPEFAELLQAAEDVLTLFSEDGFYMEDVQATAASLDDWRRYAAGARGAEIAAIGGVRDESTLAKARERMRRDIIFRDSSLHFLRRFDRLIRRMTQELGTDPMILEAADSRTGRAFMILARVSGAFD
ncbi:MAG: hypothetical protein WD969_03350 [Paracoccaceae bacterium]